MDALVDPLWLAARLEEPDLVVLDATYVPIQPDPPRDEAAEYADRHIPGARFLDLRALSTAGDTSMPPATMLADRLGAIGVRAEDRVVLYDDSPHRTAARAWWLLRRLAPDVPVALLDGGMPAWRAAGLPLAGGIKPTSPTALTLMPDRSGMLDKRQVRALVKDGSAQLVDARSPARFDGSEADPRGLPSGHIPGSVNLHYARFFDDAGRWRDRAALSALFANAGIDIDRPVATTCGSGITAAIPAFALHLLGRDAALYDGSWTEWAADPTTPKVTA